MGTALPPEKAAKVRRLRALATLLDEAVHIPGTQVKFGLDAILGLAPAVGDAVMAVASSYIIYQASKLGAPRKLLMRMALNAAVDLAAGSVPVAGDVFDVVWKANKRNVDLLEAYLAEKETAQPYIDV